MRGILILAVAALALGADAAGKWFVKLDPMTESAESRTLDREFEYIIAANPNALIMPRVCADAPGLIV